MTDTLGRQGLLRGGRELHGDHQGRRKELKDIPVATVRKEGCAT